MFNLSTPYADLYREFWSEYDKQAYWVEKWKASQGKGFFDAYFKALETEDKLIAKVEYNKDKGNRWINYLFALPPVSGMAPMEYDSICYWEGYGSFGSFVAYVYKGEHYILIGTTHYWQRLCDRMGVEMLGVHTAENFFSEYRACEVEILPPAEGDKRRQVRIHYTSGVAYGVEVSEEYHIFEMRTFIPGEMLTGEKSRGHEKVLEDMCSDDAQKGLNLMNHYMQAFPDMKLMDAYRCIDDGLKEETFDVLSQDMNDRLFDSFAKLRKTMSHDKALDLLCKDYLPMYDKDGVRINDNLARFFIAVKDGKNNGDHEREAFNALIAEAEADGKRTPKRNKKLIKDIHSDGFVQGLITMVKFIEHYYSRGIYDDVPNLQEFKHSKFLEIKEYYDKQFEKYDKAANIIKDISVARGFDDGMYFVSELVNKYLDLNIIHKPNTDNIPESMKN